MNKKTLRIIVFIRCIYLADLQEDAGKREKLYQVWDWPQLMSCDQDRREQFHSKQISIVH